jgi:hypothetical protein
MDVASRPVEPFTPVLAKCGVYHCNPAAASLQCRHGPGQSPWAAVGEVKIQPLELSQRLDDKI